MHDKDCPEVPDIHIELVLPEYEFVLPEFKPKFSLLGIFRPKKKQTQEYGRIIEFGLRIVNNSEEPIRLNLYGGLRPEILDDRGQAIKNLFFCRRENKLFLENFPLLLPQGEHTTPIMVVLRYLMKEGCNFSVMRNDGCTHSYMLSYPATYKIRLLYKSTVDESVEEEVYDRENAIWKRIDKILKGSLSTPYVDFCLSQHQESVQPNSKR